VDERDAYNQARVKALRTVAMTIGIRRFWIRRPLERIPAPASMTDLCEVIPNDHTTSVQLAGSLRSLRL